jgi:hypothetical protein
LRLAGRRREWRRTGRQAALGERSPNDKPRFESDEHERVSHGQESITHPEAKPRPLPQPPIDSASSIEQEAASDCGDATFEVGLDSVSVAGPSEVVNDES